MPEYQVALVATIEADTYDDALREAKNLAEGIGQEGENIYAETYYEHDNFGQRVLYLPAIIDPLTVEVDWDVSDHEATRAQEKAALKALPKRVTIPVEVLDGWLQDARENMLDEDDFDFDEVMDEQVADWLSDTYDYCVNGWCRV